MSNFMSRSIGPTSSARNLHPVRNVAVRGTALSKARQSTAGHVYYPGLHAMWLVCNVIPLRRLSAIVASEVAPWTKDLPRD